MFMQPEGNQEILYMFSDNLYARLTIKFFCTNVPINNSPTRAKYPDCVNNLICKSCKVKRFYLVFYLTISSCHGNYKNNACYKKCCLNTGYKPTIIKK